MLTALPNAIEINAAVFALDPHSASRPNGFPGIFFQVFWHVISKGLIPCVVQIFFFLQIIGFFPICILTLLL